MNELEATIYMLKAKTANYKDEMAAIILYGVEEKILAKCPGCGLYYEPSDMRGDECLDCKVHAQSQKEESEWLDKNR